MQPPTSKVQVSSSDSSDSSDNDNEPKEAVAKPERPTGHSSKEASGKKRSTHKKSSHSKRRKK
jgi:hypothetical protein